MIGCSTHPKLVCDIGIWVIIIEGRIRASYNNLIKNTRDIFSKLWLAYNHFVSFKGTACL